MAVNITPAYKYRTDSNLSQSVRFRRKEEAAKPRKIQRKLKIKPRHIFLWFLALGLLFLAVQKIYLFLISWEKLNITTIEIECGKPEIKSTAENFMQTRRWGNILLLDIKGLREALEIHRWIESVRIRKVFPSSLKIKIQERIPAAAIQKNGLILVDRKGTLLDPISTREPWDLPLLIDDSEFKTEFSTKLKTAWAFFEQLSSELKKQIDIINLSEYDNIQVKLKQHSLWLKLGSRGFSQNIQRFLTDFQALKVLGPLDYVDLRIPGRYIIRKRTHQSGEAEKSGFSAQEAK